MSDQIEPALAALFTHVQSAVTFSFTGDTSVGSAVIANVAVPDGAFAGLPVFGPGGVRGAVIETLDAGAGTITLSQTLSQDGTASAFITGFQPQPDGRRLKLWTAVSAFPALFMRHIADEDEFAGAGLGSTTIHAELWIYTNGGENPSATPDTVLSNLVRAVRAAFASDNEDVGALTLGGLVYWARIEGRSEYDPGDSDAYGKAVIPVKMLIP